MATPVSPNQQGRHLGISEDDLRHLRPVIAFRFFCIVMGSVFGLVGFAGFGFDCYASPILLFLFLSMGLASHWVLKGFRLKKLWALPLAIGLDALNVLVISESLVFGPGIFQLETVLLALMLEALFVVEAVYLTRLLWSNRLGAMGRSGVMQASSFRYLIPGISFRFLLMAIGVVGGCLLAYTIWSQSRDAQVIFRVFLIVSLGLALGLASYYILRGLFRGSLQAMKWAIGFDVGCYLMINVALAIYGTGDWTAWLLKGPLVVEAAYLWWVISAKSQESTGA